MAQDTNNNAQVVDQLGRIQDVNLAQISGNDVGAALAKAMTDSVKTVGNALSDPVTKKLQETIDAAKDRQDKTHNFLEKKFVDALHKKFEKDIKDIQDKLAICANTKKSKSSSDCPCESVLKTISDNIETVARTMGQGKTKSVVDLLSNINGKLTSIVKAIGNIRVKVKSSSVTTEAGDVLKKGQNGLPDSQTTVKRNDLNYSQSTRFTRSLSYQITLLEDSIANWLEQLDEASPASARIVNEWLHFDKVLQKVSSHKLTMIDKKRLRDAVVELNEAVKAQKDITEQLSKINSLMSEINLRYESYNALVHAANVGGGMLVKNFYDYTDKVVGGMVGDLNEWERESTRMGATMTGAIHSAGGASKELVANYRDMLQVSNEVVRVTHQFPAVIRKEWTKQIKKGTRSIEDTRDTVVSASAAAWQVGANAESAADEFQKWNMYVGMSSKGSVSLARTMSAVAKVTGVMGDNLLQAVSAAREIAQTMRDTGIYSQQTADSVVSWMASAQKFGIDRQVQNIFKASQGGLEGFIEASSETRNLLASSGQLSNVLKGDADPEAVMKGVGEAIRKAIPSAAFQKDAQGKPIGLPDLRKLSKAEISRLDLIMKRRFGVKLGEAVRLLEGIQDQNPEEKLAQIERDLKNPVMTKAEKEQLMLQKKQLEIAKDEKTLTKALDGITEMAEAAKMDGANLASMLKQGKLTENTFRQAITDSSQLLSQKLERQGKNFDQVMGMSAKQFETKMSGLVTGLNSGSAESKLQFREMVEKLAEANKTADSTAKNDSNTADKQETQQQVLQNTLQNLAKPLHTIAFQAPLWTWNLVSISGGVWALVSMLAKSHLLDNIRSRVSGGFGGGSTGVTGQAGTKAAGAVKDSVMRIPGKEIKGPTAALPAAKMGLPKPQMSGNDAIMKGAAKLLAIAAGVVALGTVLILATRAIMKLTGFSAKDATDTAWVLGTIITAGAGALIAAAGAGKLMEYASKVFTWGSIKDIYMGGLMLLAIIPAVGLLGLAIVGFGALLAMFITPKQAMDYAWAVGAILISASLIAIACLGAAAALSVLGLLASQAYYILPFMLAGAVALLILTPAMIGLAAAVLGMAQIVNKAVDPKWAGTVAEQTGKIMLSAATVAGAVLGAAATLTLLGLLAAVAPVLLPFMILGAEALFILTPAMVGLAWAVIKLSEWIMAVAGGPKLLEEAKTTSKAVADLLWAAGTIAGVVLGAAATLTLLGLLAAVAPVLLPFMILGAEALFILTPAAILLAKAVLWMASVFGADEKAAEEGAKTAKNTADLLSAAFKIAEAVVNMSAYGSILGAMAPVAWMLVPLMFRGADALRVLSGGVKAMAKSIFAMAGDFNKSFDLKKASESAAGMAEIIKAAMEISKSLGELAKSSVKVGVMGMAASLLSPLMNMGKGLRRNLLDPIKDSFPPPTEVMKTVATLTVLKNALSDLLTVMNMVQEIMTKVSAATIDFSALENVGGVFKAGRLQLRINAGNGGGLMTGATDITEEWMDRMLGVFTGVRSPVMSTNGGLLKGMRRGFGQAIEKPFDSVSEATNKVGTGVNKLSKNFDGLGGTQGQLNGINTRLDAIYAILKDRVAPNVEKISAATPQAKDPVKTTVNNNDLDKQIQARVEQSKPSASMAATTDYLAQIAVNTAETAKNMKEAVRSLDEMKNMMQSGGKAPVKSRSYRKEKGTTKYFEWALGKFSFTSAVQY